MKKKATIVVLAFSLVLCFAIGGSLAWLVDSTTELKNTFTYGDINISLWEHELKNDGLTLSDKVFTETQQDGFKMIPGNTIAKDPTVTVKAGSEACWLFVKVEKSANFDSFMEYSIATGWTALNDENADGVADDGIYYRTVDATTADTDDTDFAVLANNSVSVKRTVTKAMLNAADFKNPTLTFTAYAVQKANIATATEAWEIAKDSTTSSTT